MSIPTTDESIHILAASLAASEARMAHMDRQIATLTVEVRDLDARLDEAVRRGYVPSA